VGIKITLQLLKYEIPLNGKYNYKTSDGNKKTYECLSEWVHFTTLDKGVPPKLPLDLKQA